MSELETGFRIGDVIAMIARRWPVVVGSAIVGLIAGFVLALEIFQRAQQEIPLLLERQKVVGVRGGHRRTSSPRASSSLDSSR